MTGQIAALSNQPSSRHNMNIPSPRVEATFNSSCRSGDSITNLRWPRRCGETACRESTTVQHIHRATRHYGQTAPEVLTSARGIHENTCEMNSYLEPGIKSMADAPCSRIFLNKPTVDDSVAWVRERPKPTERPPLVGEVGANFWDRGCHVVSVTTYY
jgi:hypothetical protein